MTTEKRKAQYRAATKNNYENKKADGWKAMRIWIRPEWKQDILDYIKTLK